MARPTKYKPEYCQQLIDHMATGLSFESFAGKIDVCTDTLYHWKATRKKFSDAEKKGRAKCRLVWETIGIHGASGQIKDFNPATWIFNMKNRFHWRDRQDIELSAGRDGQPLALKPITVRDLAATIEMDKFMELPPAIDVTPENKE